MSKKSTVPTAFDGEIYQNIGKYARGAVLFAFERMGGPVALTDWAEENPDDFYTKLFPKIITRESEVTHHKTVDQLMDVIDGDYEVEGEDVPAPVPTAIEGVAPVALNWNTSDFDNPAEIAETVSEGADSVGCEDLVDFPDE